MPILALMLAFSLMACFVALDTQCVISVLDGLPKMSLDVVNQGIN